ncbi:NDP-sugar synthase [bacterium]|nr:NDP-sugar synthase [bacterium]
MKNNLVTKGMILGAGLGTRLLPITERYPKPLVPVLNLANILHTLALLRRHGIHEIIINLFHLPDRIEEFFKDLPLQDCQVSFSKEENLLGTGGGLKKAQGFFGGEPFVLANCDFISNLNIHALVDAHFKNQSWATMALLDDAVLKERYSAVGVNASGELCSLPRKKTGVPVREGLFTGVHVLSPEIFTFLEEKPSGINDVLYPALMEQQPSKARGVFMDGAFWFDTGDIPSLWSSSMALLDLLGTPQNGLLTTLSSFGPVYREVAPKVWTTQRTQLPDDLNVRGPALIGEGCSFESGVEIGPFSVIGDRVILSKNVRVEKSVVLSHAIVNAETVIREGVVFEGRVFEARPS